MATPTIPAQRPTNSLSSLFGDAPGAIATLLAAGKKDQGGNVSKKKKQQQRASAAKSAPPKTAAKARAAEAAALDAKDLPKTAASPARLTDGELLMDKWAPHAERLQVFLAEEACAIVSSNTFLTVTSNGGSSGNYDCLTSELVRTRASSDGLFEYMASEDRFPAVGAHAVDAHASSSGGTAAEGSLVTDRPYRESDNFGGYLSDDSPFVGD